MLSLWKLAAALLPFAAAVQSALPHARRDPRSPPRPSVPLIPVEDIPRTDRAGATLPPLTQAYSFDQLIDHTNPSLGTFQQRYWTTWEWYEQGGPIILFTPGEDNAEAYTAYLTNSTINGQIAQQEHGATIILEHRYFGLSNPFSDLSVPNLKYHTIKQAIEDLAYFAQNVQLPMPGGNSVAAPNTPWILVGGSYSGALTSWTMQDKPNIFKAGYASSAVVQAIVNFWQYFEPIRQNMPKNCSADVETAIAYIDQVFTNGSSSDFTTLRNQFALDGVQHKDDIAAALMNNLFDWQDLQPESGSDQRFYQFCDAMEVHDGEIAGPEGWGLPLAWQLWGRFWFNEYIYAICGDDTPEDCFGTYNAASTYYTDTSLDNPTRSWLWLVCNEVGYFQTGPPVGQPAVVTRLVDVAYNERQCGLMFPGAFNGTASPSVSSINSAYKGWNVQVKNLFFANGKNDPWRDATVSADGLSVASTSTQPIGVSDGFHCSDMITKNGLVDKTIMLVQQQGLAAIGEWLASEAPSKRSNSVRFAKGN